MPPQALSFMFKNGIVCYVTYTNGQFACLALEKRNYTLHVINNHILYKHHREHDDVAPEALCILHQANVALTANVTTHITSDPPPIVDTISNGCWCDVIYNCTSQDLNRQIVS